MNLLLMFWPICQSFAGGFLLLSQGASPLGEVGAFSAQANDPSAVFFNPAGITQLEGTHLLSGTTLIAPSTFFKDLGGLKRTSMNRKVFFPPNFYLTHQMNDHFSAGLGAFSPFALSTEWPDRWAGRFIATFASINTIYVNPVLAWRITPQISLAAGIDYLYSEVELKRAIDPTPLSPLFPEGVAKLEADGSAIGYNLGLLFHPLENLSLGVSYRSGIQVNYHGEVDFRFPATGLAPVDQPLRTLFPDNDVSTTINLPRLLSVGVAVTPLEHWTFAFELRWTGWSSFDKLTVNFRKNTVAVSTITLPQNYNDVFSYNLGVNYRWNERLTLRSGYSFDQSPVPDETLDPILPDSDRHWVSLGADYQVGPLTFSFAYQAGFSEARSTDKNQFGFNGKYRTFTHVAGINLGYRF